MPQQLEEKITVLAPTGVPRQCVVEYLDRCRNNVRPFAEVLDPLDYQQAQVFGHRIKGTGAAYGIPRITEIGALIEQAARRHDENEIRHQAQTLAGYLSQLEVA